MVEASATFAEGQSLTMWLTQRRAWITLLDAVWVGTTERSPMLVLRVQQVLWVEACDDSIGVVSSSAAPAARDVEVRLEGGLVLHGQLPLHAGQRLPDYLEAVGAFVPLLGAQLLRSGRPPRRTNLVMRDIVMHRDSIQTVAEASARARDGDVEEERA
jgi:hypothetical protein